VAPKREVAILVRKRIVTIFAVLGLLVDDGEPGGSIEEFLELLKKWDAITIWLPELKRIPLVREKTIVTIDRKRARGRVHGNDIPFTQTAGTPCETALVSM